MNEEMKSKLTEIVKRVPEIGKLWDHFIADLLGSSAALKDGIMQDLERVR